MSSFHSKWMDFPVETPEERGAKSAKSPSGVFSEKKGAHGEHSWQDFYPDLDPEDFEISETDYGVHGKKTSGKMAETVGFSSEGSGPWTPVCLESQRRFGQPYAMLFPLLGKRVQNPRGPGKLVRVFEKSTGVALDDKPSRVTYFEPREICLTDGPREPEPEDL